MRTIDTIIIGAGQAGLALSHCLTTRGVDHVLLERGRLAERWRSERWDSLRLLTPNWMTRLPGARYDGPDPDGFMTAGELVQLFEGYANRFEAPVREHTAVLAVARTGCDGYVVRTDGGDLRAANVVIATGWCALPNVPPMARDLDPRIHQLTPSQYRNPRLLPDGGVLVVGASATGVQLAHELRGSGRDVVIAVGRHTRLPRTYRGMDIYWWLDQMGRNDETIDQVRDPHRARTEPSAQLVGRTDRRSLDLTHLHDAGVILAGRLSHLDGTEAGFADDLATTTCAADSRMFRLLDQVDAHILMNGLTAEVGERTRIASLPSLDPPPRLDLRRRHIGTVIWATGFRRHYPWLHVPVLDPDGEIVQRRGVTRSPGLYVLGQRFQHHRNSNFIDGVGRDAEYVAAHICANRSRRVFHARVR